MPYTPPAQQSPASSKTTSPSLSRASSYCADTSEPRSPSSRRPNLPRSVSSAAYLSKQRRGPTVVQTEPSSYPQSPIEELSPSAASANGANSTGGALSSNGSIHQSPSPLNNLLIPTGAILSPPDSSENSDGEPEPRGRAIDRSWNDLEQAVRSIELKRGSSPQANGDDALPTAVSFSEPTTTIHSPTALSAEARKISHSRSSTETSLSIPDRPLFSETTTEDDDSEDSSNELRIKPPLVRKKSGELVKPALRPSSRRRYSSMPGTPTYGKSVHFNDTSNQTRHFLQVDKPSAVSAGSSPVESYESETEYPFGGRTSKSEWSIKLANFPEDTYERKSRPVRVERLFLSADTKTLIGTVAVANISFQKFVVARFTLDYWTTTSEITADYDDDVRRQNPNDGFDRFSFSIRLADQANLENKTLLLCVKYSSGGQEFWDNNDNTNYQVDFVKQLPKSASAGSFSTAASRKSLPRSRHSPPAVASGRDLSLDDDLDAGFEGSSAYHFGSPQKIMGDVAHPAIKLKPRSKRADLFRGSSVPVTNGLGGRYDFGASLSAALSNAQDKLGKQSGLMPHKQTNARNGPSYFSRAPTDPKPLMAQERPDPIPNDRPAMGSEQYKDLVQKFCYFTPGGSGKLSPPVTKPAGTDGAWDSPSTTEQSSSTSSSTPTPTQSMSPLMDGTNERRGVNVSAMGSRSGSPGPTSNTGFASRNSHINSVYYYKQNGYMPESLAPTAIRG